MFITPRLCESLQSIQGTIAHSIAYRCIWSSVCTRHHGICLHFSPRSVGASDILWQTWPHGLLCWLLSASRVVGSHWVFLFCIAGGCHYPVLANPLKMLPTDGSRRKKGWWWSKSPSLWPFTINTWVGLTLLTNVWQCTPTDVETRGGTSECFFIFWMWPL